MKIRLILVCLVVMPCVLFSQWKATKGPDFCSGTKIHVKSDSVLYLYGDLFSGVSSPLYVSRDTCKSWQKVSTYPGNSIKLLETKNNYIVTVGYSSVNPCSQEVLVSNNFGATWTDISSGLTTGSGCALFCMTITDSLLFCGNANGNIQRRNYTIPGSQWVDVTPALSTFTCNSSQAIFDLENHNGNLFAGTQCWGFLVSTDNGATWTQQNSNLQTNPIGVRMIKVEPPKIYIVQSNNGLNEGVIGTYNWTLNNPISGSNCYYDFEYKGTNKIISSCSTSQAYYSINGGLNWIVPVNPISLFNNFSLGLSANNILSVSGGFMASVNPSDSAWEIHSYGYSLNDNVGVVKSGNKLFSVAKQGGLSSSSDGGKNWIFENKLKGIKSNSLYAIDSLVFLCSQNGIYKSYNYGVSWTHINSTSGVSFKKVLKRGNTIIGATNNGIMLSVNNGNSWSSSSTTFSNPLINDLVINVDTLICATDKGLYKSTNNGLSWTLINNNLKDSVIKNVEAQYFSVFCTTNKCVYSSVNNALSFSYMYCASSKINDFFAKDSSYFVATQNGCFIKKKNSSSWLNYAWPYYPQGSVFALSSIDSLIFAGAFTGIYYMNDSKVVSLGINEESQKSDFILYPNPANQTIKVKSKDTLQINKLEIYDLVGNLIVSLKYEESVEIDVSNLKQGLYFLRIKADYNDQIIKFVKE